MEEEILKLICPVPFNLMDIKISIEETLSLIRNSLSLDCYIPVLSSQFFRNCAKRQLVPIQDLFKVLDSQEFWCEIRPVKSNQLVNGYNTLTNINMVKSSVFLINSKKSTSSLLETFLLAFRMADPKQKSRIPLETEFLFNSFTVCNRFLPRKLIKLWVERNSWALQSKSEIEPHEFLFLASNTFDRTKLMSRHMPRLDLSADEKKDGLFRIKENLMILDPDERLDKIIGNYHVIVKFDFDNPNPNSSSSGEKLGSKKTPKNEIDKIIERTLSKKKIPPNPYRKVLQDRPATRCISRSRLSLKNIINPVTRPSSVLKSEKKSIDLSKIESSSSILTGNNLYHVTSFREAIITSFRMPKKLNRTPSYIVKSKLELKN